MTDQDIEMQGRWWRPRLTNTVTVPITDQPRRFIRWLLRKPLTEERTYTLSLWTDAKEIGLSFHVAGVCLEESPAEPTIMTKPEETRT